MIMEQDTRPVPVHFWDEVVAMFERDEREPKHPLHVAQLAKLLFQQLAGTCPEPDPSLARLHAAALLHDIGSYHCIAGKAHHKKSRDLILAYPWRPELQRESLYVATIARYHRKALPEESHLEWADLLPHERREVAWLAGILRIADALDASHRQIVRQVFVDTGPDPALLFRLVADQPPDEELQAAQRKSDLLAQVCGKEILFRWHPPDANRP